MAEKNAGSTTCGNEELVFLANAIKEGRKRRLKMQLALNNLAARRRRVLNLACLLLLLISQRNITVPRPVRSCRRLKRNSGWWENEEDPSSFPAILFEWFEGFRAWHVSELS